MLMGHLPRVRFAGAVRDAGVIRAGAGRFRRYQGNNDHGARRCVKALNGACGIFLTWAPRAHAVQAEDVRDAPAPAHGGTLDGGGRGPARRVLPADAARHARAHGAVVPRAWLRADYERLGRHCDLRIQIDWVGPPPRVFLQWDACNCVSGTCAQIVLYLYLDLYLPGCKGASLVSLKSYTHYFDVCSRKDPCGCTQARVRRRFTNFSGKCTLSFRSGGRCT